MSEKKITDIKTDQICEKGKTSGWILKIQWFYISSLKHAAIYKKQFIITCKGSDNDVN